MDAALSLTMRWLHIASVVVLLGGVFYARFAVGEMAATFRPIALVAIGAILGSGLYNFLSKPHPQPHYQMWFGIKMLLVLHIFAATLVYRPGKQRTLTGIVITGALTLGVAAYLRWLSLA
jgi:hypothetical protein